MTAPTWINSQRPARLIGQQLSAPDGDGHGLDFGEEDQRPHQVVPGAERIWYPIGSGTVESPAKMPSVVQSRFGERQEELR